MIYLPDYENVQWRSRAQGPDAYDCWAFFRAVQLEHYGRDLPVIDEDAFNLPNVFTAFSEHPERQNWQTVETPEDGDGVLMGRNRRPCHVGVWAVIGEQAGVLHCAQGAGVLFQTISDLRVSGYPRLWFFRWVPNEG